MKGSISEHTQDHNRGYQDGYRNGLLDGRDAKIKELLERINYLENKATVS